MHKKDSLLIVILIIVLILIALITANIDLLFPTPTVQQAAGVMP